MLSSWSTQALPLHRRLKNPVGGHTHKLSIEPLTSTAPQKRARLRWQRARLADYSGCSPSPRRRLHRQRSCAGEAMLTTRAGSTAMVLGCQSPALYFNPKLRLPSHMAFPRTAKPALFGTRLLSASALAPGISRLQVAAGMARGRPCSLNLGLPGSRSFQTDHVTDPTRRPFFKSPFP